MLVLKRSNDESRAEQHQAVCSHCVKAKIKIGIWVVACRPAIWGWFWSFPGTSEGQGFADWLAAAG